MRYFVKGYGLFIISIFIMGLGISLVTRADLGTTAISSLPYVLSLVCPLSFGAFTALISIMYVFVEIIIMKKNFPKEQYLQFLVGPILGLSIDLSMHMLSLLSISSYVIKAILLLWGCIIMALSIVLQLKANVVNNSGEGLVKVLSIKLNREFGYIKFIFDISLVVIAIAIAFLCLGGIQGIGLGTIVSALIVGPMTRVFHNVLFNRPTFFSQTEISEEV